MKNIIRGFAKITYTLFLPFIAIEVFIKYPRRNFVSEMKKQLQLMLFTFWLGGNN